MQAKVGYSLTFMKTVCRNFAKNSESLEVCLGLALDVGFGVELGFEFEFELWRRIGLIQGSGVII